MRKPVQIIGTSIAAVAIVGGTSAVASAHPAFGHHTDGHQPGQHAFGSGFAQHGFAQHQFSQHGFAQHRSGRQSGQPGSYQADQQSEQRGSLPSRTDQRDVTPSAKDPASFTAAHRAAKPSTVPWNDSTKTPNVATHHHAFGHHLASFAQRKAAIVSGLTAADSRLTELQTKLTSLAANDPTGHAAQTLAWVTQAKQQVESLLTQVQAATSQQQLNAILAQYFNPSGTAPTPSAPTAPSAPSTTS